MTYVLFYKIFQSSIEYYAKKIVDMQEEDGNN